MKIGILGGSFDPPHICHLLLAVEARHKFKLDKVILVPAKQAPMKAKHFANAHHRQQMTEIAAVTIGAEVDFTEITADNNISYTVDTIKHFNRKYPGAELFFIIGPDTYARFEQFKEPETILKHCTLLVQWSEAQPWVDKEKVKFFSTYFTRNDMSSTSIRGRIAKGLPIDFLTPFMVKEYIRKNALYRQ